VYLSSSSAIGTGPVVTSIRNVNYENDEKGDKEEEEILEEKSDEVTRRVLVVDDVLMNRKMLCRLLEGRCDVIDIAEDGKLASEKVKRSINEGRPYDLVLMDYQMPNMDGPSAARTMRDLKYKGPIIGVTGNVLASHVENFKAHGANAVLYKPLDFDMLKKTVKDLGVGDWLDKE